MFFEGKNGGAGNFVATNLNAEFRPDRGFGEDFCVRGADCERVAGHGGVNAGMPEDNHSGLQLKF